MVMLDTNIILRYLLNDNEEMAAEAENIIRNNTVLVSIEIIAEVVYVLKRVYSIGREEIKESLLDFFDEVHVRELEIVKMALGIYAKYNLDFPDCVLYAYNRVKGYKIKTFDKKLNKLLKQESHDEL